MTTPNPGSSEALKQGCTCPVIDNHYGRGARGDWRKYGWWYDIDCPVHGGDELLVLVERLGGHMGAQGFPALLHDCRLAATAIETLITERDNQYDENVSLITRIADLEQKLAKAREDAIEEAATWHEKNYRLCIEASKDDPRLNQADRLRAQEAARHHAASATGLRHKLIQERRSTLEDLK